jgi:predicted NAD-dependent protein-ADP-ribosyltransferase YbiA (DUF1768 family)
VTIDWRAMRSQPTSAIVRQVSSPENAGAGVLWEADRHDVCELSAYGAMAWEGRGPRPEGPLYEWRGLNLLCNAAPTSFELDGERFASVESFVNALKFPEGSEERRVCAMAPALAAREHARRRRGKSFLHRGVGVVVGSSEHEGLVASAISAKVAEHREVQKALRDTGAARLVFPLTHTDRPGVLARVTPLALMIERWKAAHPRS